MRMGIVFSLCFLLVAAVVCDKKPTGTDFSNSLTLGTGLNPQNLFELTGVSTTFSASSTIYWRLESADDMGGSNVTIRIDTASGGTYGAIQELHFSNPQSYGHIMLSAFTARAAGNYRATGILDSVNQTTKNKTVASINFTVN